MAENENVQNPEAQQPQAQPEQDDQPVFQLQRCYLKDASLEMPHAPDILLTPQESAPQVDIQFEVSQRLVQADLYDITVRGTITVKAPEDKVIILAEGRQSGIFSIHGTRAGVPPVHLPEVNFEVLYQQRLAQAQAEAHAAAEKQGDAAQN